MKEPTFCSEGYPTDETLEAIVDWQYRDRLELFDFIMKAWNWPDMASIIATGNSNTYGYRFCTGGWSGNESLIYALERNRIMWALTWYSSKVGGEYVFHVKKEAQPKSYEEWKDSKEE